MIASNADRIPIQVQTGPNTWTPTWLADATPERQREAMRTWLETGVTPSWERMPVTVQEFLQLAPLPKADTPADWVRLAARSPDFVISAGHDAINVATGADLDFWGSQFGLARVCFEHGGTDGTSVETDGSYRERLKEAWRTLCGALSSGAAQSIPQTIRDVYTKALAGPPAPPPPPFTAPNKTPTEEARDKIGFVRWLVTEAQRAGSPHHLSGREWDLLKSCEARLNMGEMLSDKQRQWLDDIYMTAKRKGLTISHLLPPIPKFS